MKKYLAATLLLFTGNVLAGQTNAPSHLPDGWAPGLDKPVAGITPIVMNLWDGNPPNYVPDAPKEMTMVPGAFAMLVFQALSSTCRRPTNALPRV